MSDTAAARARRRIREEMDRLNLNQTDVAGRLDWTQSRVSKLLSGTTDLSVNDLDALCFAVGLRTTEAIRDHGLEFCAEMTPSELRLLEEIRKLDPTALSGLLGLLHIRSGHIESRGATKVQNRMKKVR